MYIPRKNRRPYRGKAKKSRPAKKKTAPAGVSNAVAKYIKKVVHTNIENKTISLRDRVAFSNWTTDPNQNMSVRPICPNLSALQIFQGTGQSERVGNTITTRKLLLRYCLYPLLQDQSYNPQPIPKEVIIWIGFLKGDRKRLPTTADYQRFYQDGITAISPIGDLWDTLMPINTDLFTICKQIRHKVGNEVYTDYSGVKPYNYFTNNDFKLNAYHTVDLTKHMNKVIKFDDATSVSDTGLYMWMTAVNANGTVETNAIYATEMSYVLRYDYEDA